MAKTSSKPKSSWLGKTCELLAVSEVLPRLFISTNGAKNGINEFRLVAGPRTGNRIYNYKIKFKKGAMAKYWKDCVFVSRGKMPLRGKSLGPNPTSKQIDTAWRNVMREFQNRPISTERLECDTKVPVTYVRVGSAPRKTTMIFGSLRLYRLPNKAGARPLFVAAFAGDGNPDGSGGGGTVHN